VTRRRRGGDAGRAARLAADAAGWALLGAGAALLVLPGPGIPVVLAGLVLLGRERPGARRLHQRARREVGQVLARVRRRAGGAVPPGR
jgi:hypothetical protein